MPSQSPPPMYLTDREKLVWYATQWLTKKYIWGGDDFSGLDCSGFIIELRCFIGLFQRADDATANGLYNTHLAKNQVINDHERKPGDFVFWFKADGKASHTAILVSRDNIIHAGGGGKPSTTIFKLIKENRFLRENLIGQFPSYSDELIDNAIKSNPMAAWGLQQFINYKDAVSRNAYIRGDHLGYRGDNFKICDIFI